MKTKIHHGKDEINIHKLYEDVDILLYNRLVIENNLGGFVANCKFLLANKFSVAEGEGYVMILPIISSQYPHLIKCIFDKKLYDDHGIEKHDVIEELEKYDILKEENVNIKILFPYNLNNTHWCLGEIIVKKQQYNYQVQIFGHNPYGRDNESKITDIIYNSLVESIKESFLKITKDAHFIFSQKDSPYNARQYPGKTYKNPKYQEEDLKKLNDIQQFQLLLEDSKQQAELDKKYPRDAASCGVIVAEELLMRIEDKDLSKTQPYLFGAEDLRKQHCDFINQHASEEDRIGFLNRNLIQSPLASVATIPVVSRPDDYTSKPIQEKNYSYKTIFTFLAFIASIVSVALGNPMIIAPYLNITGWWTGLFIESASAAISGKILGKVTDYVIENSNTKFQDKVFLARNNKIKSLTVNL